MNTGQIYHCFTGADLMLKILTQAPIPAQPAEGPFHDPPARDHHKPLSIGGPAGNLQLPPACLLDPTHDSFIAPVGPDELQTAPAVVQVALDAYKEARQEQFTARAIGDARTM